MEKLIEVADLGENHLFAPCSPFGADPGALLEALSRALPRYEVRVDLSLQGEFGGGAKWRAASGDLLGRFEAALGGMPPSGRLAYIIDTARSGYRRPCSRSLYLSSPA